MAKPSKNAALSLLNRQGMARLFELVKEGVTAATIARMRDKGLILQLSRGLYQLPDAGIEEHRIEGVTVRIYNAAKTVVDLFRYRQSAGMRYKKSPGLNLALEGLRGALRQRKATPAQIADYASDARIWKVVEPYLQAMTANA